MIETYKNITGKEKMDPNYFFKLAAFRGRGHSKKLGRSFAKKSVRRDLLSQRVLNYWNSLNSEDIEANNKGEFKEKYDKRRRFG